MDFWLLETKIPYNLYFKKLYTHTHKKKIFPLFYIGFLFKFLQILPICACALLPYSKLLNFVHSAKVEASCFLSLEKFDSSLEIHPNENGVGPQKRIDYSISEFCPRGESFSLPSALFQILYYLSRRGLLFLVIQHENEKLRDDPILIQDHLEKLIKTCSNAGFTVYTRAVDSFHNSLMYGVFECIGCS